jgi:hypothetical protein
MEWSFKKREPRVRILFLFFKRVFLGEEGRMG